MRFGIFIDYASLFINVEKIYKLTEKEKIEDALINILSKFQKYICSYYKGKKIVVNDIYAYILPDSQFNISQRKLEKANVVGIRVDSDLNKSKSLKMVNGSRDDDRELKVGVMKALSEKKYEGIVIISNDLDFESAFDMATQNGRYSWLIYFENEGIFVNQSLKDSADVAINIVELITQKEVVRKERVLLDNGDKARSGKRLEFFKDGNLVRVYYLKRRSVTLGRRSVRRNIIPNIDMTELDSEKILSREHGIIHIIDEKIVFSVNQNCTRGTWYGTKLKKPNEQFVVKEGEPVLLGDKNGFLMYYFSK